MKSILMYILLFIYTDDINEIATINRLKNEAEEAYNQGNYAEAIQNYSYLYDTLRQDNDKILLNLSNAYFNAQDTSNAQFHYNKLTDSQDNKIKSIAHQQLGVIANNMGKYDVALEQFKNSLRANPENNDARYNYELLKRLMQKNQQQQQNQQQQNKDQQNKDQQNKDQQNQDQQQQDQQQQDQQNEDEQNQEQQQNEQQQQDQEKQEEEQQKQQQESSEEENEKEQAQPQPQDMEEMEISEEMARMILEAMRNNEVQYIQQTQKKATKPKDNSKPDW